MIIKIFYLLLIISFFTLTISRFILSNRFFNANKAGYPRELPSESEITILQPILSGDDTLENNLRTNLELHPQANFIWLIDQSDTLALSIAKSILNNIKNHKCKIIETPEVANGVNPKTFKLQIGSAVCTTPYIGIIDDDTVLPELTIAKAIYKCKENTLVTGLPFYTTRKNIWSSLLTAFVNSNSLFTYPVMAMLTPPATINGMFYVLRKQDLEKHGGFTRIQNQLCDDYAIASLFKKNGGQLVQSDVTHPVATTVNSFQHYFSLSRRWMIFANRFIKENFSPLIVIFIVIPSLLPLLLLVTSSLISAEILFLTLMILVIKASAARLFRRHILTSHEKWHQIILEVIADIILPISFISALYKPNQFNWRNKKIKILNERITYE